MCRKQSDELSGQAAWIGASNAPSDQAGHRAWLCSLVDAGAIGSLLDVGCGDGAYLRALAAKVPQAAARFVGIDASATAIHAAQSAAAGDGQLTFYEQRIENSLPFDDAMFDVVFSNNFLECVGDKAAFLREVARVLRPGGQVVCAHWDWDSQTFDGADKALVRRVVQAFADWQQPWMEHCDGWMGRRLWATFQSTGLFEGTMQARVMTNTVYAPPWYGHARLADCAALVERGMIGGDDYRRLIEDVEQQAAADRYFYCITGYAYVGHKRRAPLA